jgi:hypothetical protein
MNKDYLAIMKLIHSFPRYLDDGDAAALGKLFEHGSLTIRYDGPGGDAPPYKGYEAVKGFFYEHVVKSFNGEKPRTRHFIANVILDIEDDAQAATAQSYYVRIDPSPSPGQPLPVIITGRYEDRFAKFAGKWCFAERKTTSDYSASALFQSL